MVAKDLREAGHDAIAAATDVTADRGTYSVANCFADSDTDITSDRGIYSVANCFANSDTYGY